MSVPWLADVLRTAGMVVVEHAGWRTRAAPGLWEPRFGIVHATAAPASQPDDTQVRIVRDGREGLPGPIANACVDRSGRWHVLAAGRCNTTLQGTAGPYLGLGNRYALGVEACNNNINEPWPRAQYWSYYRGWAAIGRRMGWDPTRLRGHKEHTPGHKTDPTFSMSQFRTDVARALAGQDYDMPLSPDDIRKVADATAAKVLGRDWQLPGRTLAGSVEALIAYGQADAVTLQTLLTAIVNDPNNPVTLTPAQVEILAGLLAAKLPSAAEIADKVADEASARLAD